MMFFEYDKCQGCGNPGAKRFSVQGTSRRWCEKCIALYKETENRYWKDKKKDSKVCRCGNCSYLHRLRGPFPPDLFPPRCHANPEPVIVSANRAGCRFFKCTFTEKKDDA